MKEEIPGGHDVPQLPFLKHDPTLPYFNEKTYLLIPTLEVAFWKT